MPKELKSLDDFDEACEAAGSERIMAVMYYNDKCKEAEEGYAELEWMYSKLVLCKCQTQNVGDVRDKYADGGSKPYFYFYKDGEKIDTVAYAKKWANQSYSVKEALKKHNGGDTSYRPLGTVHSLQHLGEFDEAVKMSGSKAMVVMYMNDKCAE
jgi:hypothetical protein